MSKQEFQQLYNQEAKRLTGQKLSENEIAQAYLNYEELLYVSSANDADLTFNLDDKNKLHVVFCPR